MRAWVVVCVLLPAALASASEVRIAAPGATRVEAPAVIRQGNWEVAVSFDPNLCEISCVYRLRADRVGRAPVADLLLPPAIDLRVFFNGSPATFTVDPAHTRHPRLGCRASGCKEPAALPAADGPRRPSLPLVGVIERPSAVRAPERVPVAPLAPLPLRV